MAYDYASEILGPKKPEKVTGGYDYASEILDDTGVAAPGAQLADTRQRMPEYEEGEPEELGFFGEMKEMWTGDRRRTHDWEEVPVNVQTPNGVVPIQDHMSQARDNDLSRAQIFQTQLPDADVDWDENMNPFTTYFGEPRYLNRPGASMGDLSEVITQLPAEYLAARTGASAGKVLGATGQMLGAGGALFGTSAAQDKFAQIWGSDQPVDWKRAQMMGLFGAGGEGVGLLMGKFFNRFFSSGKYVKKSGEFTQKGRDTLKSQGIDPDNVTKEFREAFINMIDEAVEPRAATAFAQAETLPKSVRLSRGDVTRNVRDQQIEDLAERGSLGHEPYKTIDEFRIAQRKELEANRDLIQGGIRQSDDSMPSVAAAGEGMEAAQGAMQATRQAMHRSMKQAYDEADSLGMRVDINGLKVVRDHIMDSIRTFPRRNNAVRDELAELNKVVQTRTGPRVRNVSIRELEELRSRLTTMTQSADKPTSQAARVAVRSLDEGLETAVEMGAYTGNVDALKAYNRGISARRLIGKMYEQDAIVKRIMEPTAGPYSLLKRPPNEAANMIFSGSALGFKDGSEKALKRIRTNLLAAGNNDSWNAIREEAVWRLFKPTVSADIMSDGSYAFSGKRFATAFDKAMRDHKRVIGVMFTPQEQGLLRQFRNVAVNATVKNKGAENFSNTTVAGARLLETVFGKGARLVNNAVKAFQTARDFAEQSRATKLMTESVDYGRGYRPPGRRLPPGTTGGLSAIGAAEDQRRQNRMSQRERRRLQR